MRVLIERSVLRDLVRQGAGTLAALEDEITRKGLSPDTGEDPEGDHCRCTYRHGTVTVIGTYTKADNTLLLDRVALDEVVDVERDRLPVAFLSGLVRGTTPLLLWREHRGLTQRDLAARIGVKPGYLSEVERGLKRGSLPLLTRAAAVLEVTVEELMGGSAPPAPKKPLSP
ncbi:MAG: hypothetical protein RLY86_3988 [Pseudomonadota bacterium]|jgi:DNA-binding XRE family transcriptional regulator